MARAAKSRSACSTAAILLFIGVLLSCSPRRVPPPAVVQQKKITIGFSLDSLIVERWIRDRDVFVSTANALGADVIFQNAGNDLKNQLRQVQYLIDRGVDVLVIIPLAADAFTEVIQKAKSRGIRIISYDRLVKNAGVDLYISVNSFEAGRIMAEVIIQAAPAGDYVFMNGPESDNNVALLSDGIRSVLIQYPGVYHVLDSNAENWSYDFAYQEMSRFLESGKRPDAVICGNDGLAGGVIRALAEYRLAGKIPVVGQDADITACQRIVEGTQLATVYKPITNLAREAARYSVALARGEYVPPEDTIYDGVHSVPVHWLAPLEVNKGNIGEVIIKSGFHTAEEIYR